MRRAFTEARQAKSTSTPFRLTRALICAATRNLKNPSPGAIQLMSLDGRAYVQGAIDASVDWPCSTFAATRHQARLEGDLKRQKFPLRGATRAIEWSQPNSQKSIRQLLYPSCPSSALRHVFPHSTVGWRLVGPLRPPIGGDVRDRSPMRSVPVGREGD